MNNICRYLGITVAFTLILALTSCTSISDCEVQSKDADKASVQSNNSMYSKIFGKKQCSPKKIVVRVPVNFKIEEAEKGSSSKQQYQPKITTLVTFSSEYRKFHVRRIDEDKNGGFYSSKKDTCLAWKWSGNNNQQTLTLSMERNLQISDKGIKNVIFLVVLPVEIKEAATKVILKRYAWDRYGGIDKFNLKRKYPVLKNTLRQNEQQRAKASEAFVDGQKVSNQMTAELKKIVDEGGVHLDESFASLGDTEGTQKYIQNQESPSCEIPNDLKKS